MTTPDQLLCPACLTLGMPPETAVAQVDGTRYCAHHAVQALAAMTAMQRGGPKPMFTNPSQQTIVDSPPR